MRIEKVTKRSLVKRGVCEQFINWFMIQGECEPLKILHKLIEESTYESLLWANKGLIMLMTKKERVQYTIYAAKTVLDNFEILFPSDKRPRNAIESATKYIKSPRKKTILKARVEGQNARSAAFMADLLSCSNETKVHPDPARVHKLMLSANSAAVAAEGSAYTVGLKTGDSIKSAIHSIEAAARSAEWKARTINPYIPRTQHKTLLKLVGYGINIYEAR
jgi:hypothetical protein